MVDIASTVLRYMEECHAFTSDQVYVASRRDVTVLRKANSLRADVYSMGYGERVFAGRDALLKETGNKHKA